CSRTEAAGVAPVVPREAPVATRLRLSRGNGTPPRRPARSCIPLTLQRIFPARCASDPAGTDGLPHEPTSHRASRWLVRPAAGMYPQVLTLKQTDHRGLFRAEMSQYAGGGLCALHAQKGRQPVAFYPPKAVVTVGQILRMIGSRCGNASGQEVPNTSRGVRQCLSS